MQQAGSREAAVSAKSLYNMAGCVTMVWKIAKTTQARLAAAD